MFLKHRTVFIIVLVILLIITEFFPVQTWHLVERADRNLIENNSEIFYWQKYSDISLLNTQSITYAETISDFEENVNNLTNEKDDENKNLEEVDEIQLKPGELTEYTENTEELINSEEDVQPIVIQLDEKDSNKREIQFEETENESEKVIEDIQAEILSIDDENNELETTDETVEKESNDEMKVENDWNLTEFNVINEENHKVEDIFNAENDEQRLMAEFNQFITHDEDEFKQQLIVTNENGNICDVPVVPGVAGVSLLNEPNLSVDFDYPLVGNPLIKLTYSGNAALNLSLISNSYIIFYLPSEISNIITRENLSVYYDVPRINLLGLPILRDNGFFEPDQICIIGNQVFVNYFELLSLNLLGIPLFTNDYLFELTINLPYLPYTPEQKFAFLGHSTKQLVDLSVLDGSDQPAVTELNINGVLEFENVPDTILFQTTPIPTQPQYVNRQEANFAITVKDTRGMGGPSWRIDAQLSNPLEEVSDQSKQLEDALIFRLKDHSELTLTPQAQTIYNGETGNTPLTEINWTENEGPLIYVNPNEVRVGEYKTDIIWTLVDAP